MPPLRRGTYFFCKKLTFSYFLRTLKIVFKYKIYENQTAVGTLLRPQITVHLNAVRENYARIRKYASNAEICPVVKSDAYGLGAVEVTRAFIDCGCRNFYVSTPLEGVELRNNFPDIQINVLNGLQNGSQELFRNYRLTPVINSLEQLKNWENLLSEVETSCILNVETGFNRLGLPEKDWALCTSERLKNARVSVMMTHFSCVSEAPSDDVERNRVIEEQNRRQYAAYDRALQRFQLPGSVALDAYVQNSTNLPIAQIRTGAALYGINVFPEKLNLQPTITLEVPVLQTETIRKGERVGYGATWEAKRDTVVAVLGIGYSHGLPRSLSNRGTVWFPKGTRRYPAPIVGRLSMGLTTCDVTDIPSEAVWTGNAMILDEHYTINELCMDADRLDSEILCNFKQMDWRYVG